MMCSINNLFNFLPLSLEDIIINYKEDLEKEEHKIKFQKCLDNINKKFIDIDFINELLGYDEQYDGAIYASLFDGGASLDGGAYIEWG